MADTDSTPAWVNNTRAMVRPFALALFSVCLVWLTYQDKVDPAVITTIATSIVSYYFGERSGLKVPGNGADSNR